MKKRLLIMFTVLLLVSCGGDGKPDVDAGYADSLSVEHIEVDGKEITCVVYSAISQGGLDCDW